MSKSAKLTTTFLLFVMIITVITVSVLSAQQAISKINNTVQFLVDDIEGEFYYGIEKLPANGNENYQLFQNYVICEWSDAENAYVAKNTNGELLPAGAIPFTTKDVKFTETNPTISYYFAFINHGVNNPEISDDNRSITITANARENEWFINENDETLIKQQWTYEIMRIANATPTDRPIITTIQNFGQQEGVPPHQSTEGQPFDLFSGVTIPAYTAGTTESTGYFSYILIEYKLTLQSFKTNINNSFVIDINI